MRVHPLGTETRSWVAPPTMSRKCPTTAEADWEPQIRRYLIVEHIGKRIT